MRFWKKKDIPGNPRVGIGVASCFAEGSGSRKAVQHLLSAFQQQTYANWTMLVLNDGPMSTTDREEMGFLSLRVAGSLSFYEMERKGHHGHPHRQTALTSLMNAGCNWLMSTNADNYYMPVFLEALLAEGAAKDADVVYCDMVHSHQLWKPMTTKFQYKHLDLGGFIVRDRLARKVAFDKFTFNGDGDWIDRLAAATTPQRVVKVPHTLFVHN